MKAKKGCFQLNYDRLKASGRETTTDEDYDCTDCVESETPHKIISVPGPPAEGGEFAIKGEATTVRVCTGCGREDGPWVPA